METTLLSTLLIWAIRLVGIGALLALGYSTIRSIEKKQYDVIKWNVLLIVIIGLIAYYFPNTIESNYRPRSAPKATVQTSDRRSKEVPFVAVSNAPTWDQKMATNRAQNAKSQAEFDKLPEKP